MSIVLSDSSPSGSDPAFHVCCLKASMQNCAEEMHQVKDEGGLLIMDFTTAWLAACSVYLFVKYFALVGIVWWLTLGIIGW